MKVNSNELGAVQIAGNVSRPVFNHILIFF